MKQIGKNVTACQGDVSKLADLDRLYATVKQQKGRIDVLFANAGGGEFAPLGRSPRSTSTRCSASTSRARCSPCRRRCR